LNFNRKKDGGEFIDDFMFSRLKNTVLIKQGSRKGRKEAFKHDGTKSLERHQVCRERLRRISVVTTVRDKN
jgi:hypothetical protein